MTLVVTAPGSVFLEVPVSSSQDLVYPVASLQVVDSVNAFSLPENWPMLSTP